MTSAIAAKVSKAEVVGNDAGGKEWRNLVSSMPRFEYEVAHAAKLPKEYKPLRAFFLNMRGRADSFRYWDHLDYEVASGEANFLQIDSTHYQMRKAYAFGSQTMYRNITKPISGTVSGIANMVSVDYATGIVTTSGTPSGGTWQFHVHARFDVDAMKAETVERNPSAGYIVNFGSIMIVEIKAAD